MPIAAGADRLIFAASSASSTVPTKPVARPSAPAVGSVDRLEDPSAFPPRYTVASIFEPPRSMPTTSASSIASDSPMIGRYHASVAPGTDSVSPPPRYLDGALSWLAFNRRVLDRADSSAMPLLERLRFLGIVGTNLDEFFMVRVPALRRNGADRRLAEVRAHIRTSSRSCAGRPPVCAGACCRC